MSIPKRSAKSALMPLNVQPESMNVRIEFHLLWFFIRHAIFVVFMGSKRSSIQAALSMASKHSAGELVPNR